jgi:TRAP transporter TAXI family solute receptor
MLMGASTLYWSWVVRPESNIKTLADIKGKRINYVTPGHGMKKALGDDMLNALGIDPAKDVKQVTVDDPNVAKAGVQQGKIDALLTALVGGKLMELKSLANIQVLDITPEMYNAFRPELKQIMVSRRLPAKHLAVLDRPTWVIGHQSLLMTRDDTSDELAYAIVKTIMEHARELDEVSPVFKEWGAEGYVLPKDLAIPFHPGAVKYFKEKGMWTADLQTQHDALLAELAKVSK